MTRRGFAAGGLLACAGLGLGGASAFIGDRALPQGGPNGAPVLIFTPVARGRMAPLHRDFAQGLARNGYYVITPLAIDAGAQRQAAIAFAAAEGADVSRRGVLGYDGGVRAVAGLLARDPGLRVGLAIPGPLGLRPIAPDRRLLTLDGRQGLLDPRSAERLLDETVQRLVQNGLHHLV